MDTKYDVLADFKAKALEILDTKNKYCGGIYIMNLTKEAGLGVIKSTHGFNVMDTLAESVRVLTAKALAIAFVAAEIGTGKDGRPNIRDDGLLLVVVNGGVFSAWKCPYTIEEGVDSPSLGVWTQWRRPRPGQWMDITKGFTGIGEEELMMKIYKDSSFELSAIEVVPERILAGVTII